MVDVPFLIVPSRAHRARSGVVAHATYVVNAPRVEGAGSDAAVTWTSYWARPSAVMAMPNGDSAYTRRAAPVARGAFGVAKRGMSYGPAAKSSGTATPISICLTRITVGRCSWQDWAWSPPRGRDPTPAR